MYMWTLTELLGVCRKQWIKWQRTVYWEIERWWNLMSLQETVDKMAKNSLLGNGKMVELIEFAGNSG